MLVALMSLVSSVISLSSTYYVFLVVEPNISINVSIRKAIIKLCEYLIGEINIIYK